MRKVSLEAVIDGDGATVKRLMPVAGLRNFDPFVLMDHFVLEKGMGFPTHPHRGFEGITYLFSGSMNHKDNLGNNETILAGGLQRFTAGSGIEHSEIPSDTEITEGIQLWVNLPLSKKNIPPDYQQVLREDVQVIENNGVFCRSLVGEKGMIDVHEKIIYEDIQIKKGSTTLINNAVGNNQIVYLMQGELSGFDGSLKAGEALLIDDKNELHIRANEDSRFILLSGKPIGEPIYQHGPYVD